MLFNSIEFLFFILVVYAIYLLLNHYFQNWFLIAASLLFYAAWSWKFISVMLISITTDYWCAKKIDNSQDPKTRRMFLWLSISVNLSILAFFKYFNFFASNVMDLLGHFHLLPLAKYVPLDIILPLGISFYTFEAISYVVDVYRRQTKPAQNYKDYLLFVIYFPHLIAGPIMRAKSFLPQITTARSIKLDQFYEGCYLFFWGLFEKMFIADNMAQFVNPVFAASSYQGAAVLLALYAFAFQILCDFDGYSNMARGLGKCMGFEITINFKLPYFSTNPREFWQRWHISLSTWLRDYLYIPLGGNRNGQAKTFMALLVTMLLGGFWHGASWTFVLWGFYQGVLLIGHRLMSKKSPSKELEPQKITARYVLKAFVFFNLVVLGWLFFRATSVGQVGSMLQAMVFNFHFTSQDALSWLKFSCIILPFMAIQFWQYKSNDLMILYKQKGPWKLLIYAFLTYLVMGWGVMKAEEFVYFQF